MKRGQPCIVGKDRGTIERVSADGVVYVRLHKSCVITVQAEQVKPCK